MPEKPHKIKAQRSGFDFERKKERSRDELAPTAEARRAEFLLTPTPIIIFENIKL